MKVCLADYANALNCSDAQLNGLLWPPAKELQVKFFRLNEARESPLVFYCVFSCSSSMLEKLSALLSAWPYSSASLFDLAQFWH